MVAGSVAVDCGIALGVLAALLCAGVHTVDEGHVGLYWRGGRLLEGVTPPGIHVRVPLLTRFEPVQVTLQTDKVINIPCGTKGGTVVHFDRVEVVNRLDANAARDIVVKYGTQYDKPWIFDKVHHEINQFCSKHTLQEVYIDMFDQVDEIIKDALQADITVHAPGLEILAVRVTKPSVPDSVRANYESLEEERTQLQVSIERQKRVQKELETERERVLLEARTKADAVAVAKESERQQRAVDDEILLASRKAAADAEHYRATREAEANAKILTPEFLELQFIRGVANTTKIYFGEKIPGVILDQRLLPNYAALRQNGAGDRE